MSEHVLSDEDAETYLAIGIKPSEIVKLRWPDCDDGQADYLLWEFTPFPLVMGIHDIADAVAEIDLPRTSKAASAQYGVPCDRCGAGHWEPCRSASGRVTDTHRDRLDAATSGQRVKQMLVNEMGGAA